VDSYTGDEKRDHKKAYQVKQDKKEKYSELLEFDQKDSNLAKHSLIEPQDEKTSFF
jgi:hypothetical protein